MPCFSGELANSIRSKTDLRFGLYYSLYEWYNPLYLNDKANNFDTTEFVNQKSLPCLYEIVSCACICKTFNFCKQGKY